MGKKKRQAKLLIINPSFQNFILHIAYVVFFPNTSCSRNNLRKMDGSFIILLWWCLDALQSLSLLERDTRLTSSFKATFVMVVLVP